ncbi:MAG: gliding motility-associated C-terminal domain-containing protein [Bacteroidia bacterium]
MKKLNNIEDLDQLFKTELDKVQTTPPADVWSHVASSASSQSASVFSQMTSYLSSVTNLVKLALFVGGIGTVGVLLYQANTKPSNDQPNPTGDNAVTQLDNQELDSDIMVNSEESDNNESEELNNTISTHEGEETDQSTIAVDGQQNGESDIITDTDNAPVQDYPDSDNPDVAKPEIIISSISHNCCLGETRTFSSGSAKGNWLIDGKLVKSNSEVFSHRFTAGGDFNIEFRTADAKAEYAMKVQDYAAAIVVKDLGNGQYQVSLNSEATATRWLVNGKLMSTNEVFNPILSFGKNHIAVEARSGECTVIKEKIIQIKGQGSFSVPYNIITPNGDGRNETYEINIEHFTKFHIQIYDQNFNRVFESKDPKMEWNGTIGNVGANCPAGVYIVKITYQLEGEEINIENYRLTLTR